MILELKLLTSTVLTASPAERLQLLVACYVQNAVKDTRGDACVYNENQDRPKVLSLWWKGNLCAGGVRKVIMKKVDLEKWESIWLAFWRKGCFPESKGS